MCTKGEAIAVFNYWKVMNPKILSKYSKLSCAMCGTFGNLQIHHLDGDKRNNKENNHQILCFNCHRLVHTKEFQVRYIDSHEYQKGFLKNFIFMSSDELWRIRENYFRGYYTRFKMTYKIYSQRVVFEDLGIEVADEESAKNVLNVLAAQGNTDVEYSYEEIVQPVVEAEEESVTDGDEETEQ